MAQRPEELTCNLDLNLPKSLNLPTQVKTTKFI
jgi:hypothetical protein